jgi:hypothetical protein
MPFCWSRGIKHYCQVGGFLIALNIQDGIDKAKHRRTIQSVRGNSGILAKSEKGSVDKGHTIEQK